MADSGITVADDGSWVLSGELDFDTVPALLAHKGARMKQGHDIRVDLAGVTRVDSAGLALLVEWLRESKRKGLSISFEHVPEQLASIAQICGLEEILFTHR
jgi:phospholipid transport system transporter-binding protein